MSKTVGRCWGLGLVVLLAALVTFQLPGCGGGGGSAPTGTLKVGLTDAQRDEFANVVVTIKEVRVVPAGLENAADDDARLPVVASFATPKQVDILSLRFQQELLGQVVLPAGSYNQVRLVLAPNPSGQGKDPLNYLVLKAQPLVKIPLDTPSGQQSGLKVLGRFTVTAGIINAIVLDFDPNTAIVNRGNGQYNLKPTGIRIVQTGDIVNNFGSLTGTVTAMTNWSSATVSVVPQGSVNAIAAGNIFSNYTSGTYRSPFSAFVPSGTYRLHVQAAGFSPYSSPLTPVSAGQETSLGQIQLK